MSEIRIRTVSWLVRQIAFSVDREPSLHNVVLEGEVFNFTAHSSGHWYFSLKDEHASIRAIMWENDNLLVCFQPREGDRIRVLGDVKIYQAGGTMQLVVRKMAIAGAGDLKAKFDALYKKLENEGLFSVDHKKPLPHYPMNIGLVTGRETHARADVLNTLGRRWPVAEIFEYPVLVQGNRASADIVQALKRADGAGHDVILLCRGGGSQEDLWCFNDELLARTIYAMKTPLVTGVGHEPDWTMVDYVADLRAPTPTGAAERCSPDIHKVYEHLEEQRHRILVLCDDRLKEARMQLDDLSGRAVFENPLEMFSQRRLKKELLKHRLLGELGSLTAELKAELSSRRELLSMHAATRIRESRRTLKETEDEMIRLLDQRLLEEERSLRQKAGLLDAYSPLKILERGYAVVSKNDTAVSDAEELKKGDRITVRLHRGSAEAEIQSVHKGD